MPTLLITGANRGLGLEFVTQYAREGWRVIACCRDPGKARELQALATKKKSSAVTVHALDVSDFGAVDALSRSMPDESIDLLLNNAGVYGSREKLGKVEYEVWARTLRVNTMGPLKMVEAFVEQVARSQKKQVVNVSSLMGSIADNGSGGSYAYRSSKAALNMVTMSLSHDLQPRGIGAFVIHPGWVATDMGGPEAPTKTPDSVAGMRAVIAKATLADSGKFFDWEGNVLPW
jgi:NAD(P)-dependent dehydrogenase (short-subunit alcohol dehydrogenase family)